MKYKYLYALFYCASLFGCEYDNPSGEFNKIPDVVILTNVFCYLFSPKIIASAKVPYYFVFRGYPFDFVELWKTVRLINKKFNKLVHDYPKLSGSIRQLEGIVKPLAFRNVLERCRLAPRNSEDARRKSCQDAHSYINRGIKPDMLIPVNTTYTIGHALPEGISALNTAILNQVDISIITALLKKDANANSPGFPRAGFYTATPLIYFAAHCQYIKDKEYVESVIHELLAHEAKIDQTDELGNSALYYAAMYGDGAAVKKLLNHQACILANHNNETAITAARQAYTWAVDHHDSAAMKNYAVILAALERHQLKQCQEGLNK